MEIQQYISFEESLRVVSTLKDKINLLYFKYESLLLPKIRMDKTGEYNSRSVERFGDMSIDYLNDPASLSPNDFYAYSWVVAEILDNADRLFYVARRCWNIDDYHSLTRLGIERESLASMMMMRVEQVGLNLTIRPSALSRLRRFVRDVFLCSPPRNYWLGKYLVRVEDRLGRRCRRAISDPGLAPAMKDMLVEAFDSAKPGKALRQS